MSLIARLTLIAFVELLRTSVAARSADLLLYGGRSHDEFIGCISCNKFDSGSVCNKFGDQGSKFSDKSIWNKFADYGSKFSDVSPWNKFASYPPVIVDRDGKFYGYFTANKFSTDRTTIPAFVSILDNVDWVTDDYDRARDTICGD